MPGFLFRPAVLLYLASAVLSESNHFGGSGTPCYDERGKPQYCIPPFENAAFGLEVEATNTCGENGDIEFCVQTSAHVSSRWDPSCDICSSGDHKTTAMTDSGRTWWQSETMYEGIQAPNQVNLTLHFGKAFDVTYVRVSFASIKPHSFRLLKKSSEDGDWKPWNYYSANCTEMYGLPDMNYILPGDDETKALCVSEFSDLSPLTGGSVPFATLEGRPSRAEFDSIPALWDFVVATDIRITLDRLNTLGDEIFKDPRVLKSYFYRIDDIAVGARCRCNGHASECPKIISGDVMKKICVCRHFTAGPDCNQCQDFYNDAPWRRATKEDANECKQCNCNNFSKRCYFDKELYEATGHGGHCVECSHNRDGPNCERCRPNYYLPDGQDYCLPCDCNETGSWNLQCNIEGKCMCKPGVMGDKCDVCSANFYDFGPQGCKECECQLAGSFSNEPKCDPHSGICSCKENVEGKQCTSCKPDYFNLDEANEFGCTPCFCYGHSSVCTSSPGYSKVLVESSFARSTEKWAAEEITGNPISVQHNSYVQALEIAAPRVEPVYFLASERFLGDHRAAYNHDLAFKLRIGDNSPMPTREDIVLEGGGLSVTHSIIGQDNPSPSTTAHEYKFRLSEHPQYGWQPRLPAKDFIRILANLTALKIRGSYVPQGVGFLDDVTLETARRGSSGYPATWIEMCSCPDGYIGQFCESCAPGFRHEPVSGDSFAPCVPCNCNKHAEICDPNTGRCICEHNTGGNNCEKCARGYYGNALEGTANDCKPCPCPNRGGCLLAGEADTIVCIDCPIGYSGPRCEICSDGYFGDPLGKFGPVRFCEKCDCSSNIDENAIGNCNRTSGECLKCIYNTRGPHCDLCLPGYYGDALAVPKGDCRRCQCYPLGTVELPPVDEDEYGGVPSCDHLTGQCQCKPHVIGKNCDSCEEGFFNMISGQGCESCECDPIGSDGMDCDKISGQCRCRPGVTGAKCNMCLPNFFGFSTNGCKACHCDILGSTSLQCDNNGQCPCLPNVEGLRCDRCKENKFDKQRDCVDCPPCYNLIQSAVNDHRNRVLWLEKTVANITSSPTIINDEEFDQKLKQVYEKVEKLSEQIKNSASSPEEGGRAVAGQLGDLYKRLDQISKSSEEAKNLTKVAKSTLQSTDMNVTATEQTIEQAKKALQFTADYLQTEGLAALSKALARSNKVGEQSDIMTQIAREARTTVEKQEKEAESYKMIALEAVNISTEAYMVAKDAINQQKSVSEELKKMNSTLLFMGEKLNATAEQAAYTKAKVAAVHNEALSLYSDAYGLSIPPSLNADLFKSNASAISKEATLIKEQAEKLLTDNDNLMKEAADEVDKAEELLSRVKEQQQLADDLLQNVKDANDRAQKAVELGDKTLQEAQETYDTLQEFNKLVQESKDKSQDWLKRVPEIEKAMNEAREKTWKVQQALSGAESNAQNAREMAQTAEQKYAKQASEEAYDIRKKADATLSGAGGNLIKNVEEISEKMEETGKQLNALEDQAEKDRTAIITAKEKVGQAKTNAAEVKKQVEKALEEVNNITKELMNLPEIDEGTLNELTKRLEIAQKEFEEAKIDEELDALRKAKYARANQVSLYQEEYNRLRREVDNMDEIRKALPDGCWRGKRLEDGNAPI